MHDTDPQKLGGASVRVPESPPQDDPAPPRRRGRRRIVGKDGPDPIDVHIAQRLRLCRTLRGFSQGALAVTLGMAFQQIQKYEKGRNRIAASTLYRLAEALDVPVSFFYDGLDRLQPPLPLSADSPVRSEPAQQLDDYQALPPEIKACIARLAEAVIRGGGGKAPPE